MLPLISLLAKRRLAVVEGGMRERIKGGSKPVQEAVKQTCPYLGLAHDQFGHLPEPSSEHRCYLYMQRERIDQSHQERFCLTTSYLNCPWLMVSPAAAGQGDSPWQRFSESLRERFDEMERVTMRNRWPRAFVAVLIFIAQMTAKAAVETWRVCAPVVGPFLERRWIELRAWALRSWLKFKNRSARPAIQKAAPRSTTVSTPAAAPSTLHFETVADEVSLGPAVEPTPVTNGAHVQSSGEGVARPVVETHTLPGFKWECANCFTYNPPSVTFCQHCGRLSTHVEEELLAKEDFFTLDGLKALMAGDEDGAHRYFTLATQANPQSELAWRWRSRTAATLNGNRHSPKLALPPRHRSRFRQARHSSNARSVSCDAWLWKRQASLDSHSVSSGLASPSSRPSRPWVTMGSDRSCPSSSSRR
jgi:hypothetical protein